MSLEKTEKIIFNIRLKFIDEKKYIEEKLSEFLQNPPIIEAKQIISDVCLADN